MLLPHMASRLYGMPLLIARSKLDVILSVLGERIGWPEPSAALPVLAPRPRAEAPPGIAMIPVYGTLVRRTVGLEAASGLASYGDIAAMMDAAIADPGIDGILLEVDSPGGEAGGVFELGERIRAADAVKPVWAIASDSAFSAAYAIACAASRLAITRTGGVGSIGVIAMHVDQSVRDTQQGYRYTAITAGNHKNDFSPHEPLDQEAGARLQAEVDRLYGMFADHVASMRKITPEAVRATQARLYFGDEAVGAGLADAVASLDTVLTDFSHFLAARRSPLVIQPGSTRAISASHQKEITKMQSNATHEDRHPIKSDTDPEPDLPDPSAPKPSELDEVKAVRADALAIAELCQLAGVPHRTAEFLAQGASESQVRRVLLAARAESIEITSTIAPDAAPTKQSNAANPMLAAIKKLTGKD
ncbi:MAG: Clp protease ClpP [Hydrogenophilales bacterium CG_4_9_14_3_um_filter_59_35]|nr:MAG: Clp protease ClpP [Hydrogenophilales bacterium CG18_big_fil_WC_8_21_14_2_50_58_12]PIY01600.1 MAG: Clp protease ClpP [Hydrogenophilales bacterium CG_4_10_14_3_um_filter_58_23]PJB07739.1 MAG: Clp protease ClpP [Hydrogenophilales bacterium CG_4_9_14_3_um_filter_59_35]